MLPSTGVAMGGPPVACRRRPVVLGFAPARRGDKLQVWLAAWAVALIVLAPFAHPSLSVELTGALAASAEPLVAPDDAMGEQPAAKLRPVQPVTPGILSRALLLDTALSPPPAKAPLLRPAPDQPLFAVQATPVPRGEPREVLHRSSVGTARTPTGPPA